LGLADDSLETKSDQDEDDQDCQVGYRVSKSTGTRPARSFIKK
jgi:hypothetical protein